MKKRTLLLLFLIKGLLLFGQYNITPHQVDSLTQLVAKTKADTVKHDALFWLGITHRYTSPSQSVHYFNEALLLARKIDDKDRILGDLVTLGLFYSNIGEPVKSIDLLQEALHTTEAAKSDISMALAFLANNYEAQGDLKNAIDYARKSYLVYEKRVKDKLPSDERGYPAGPMRMGQLFEKMNQLDSAMYYAQLSYKRVLEKPMIEMEFFYCQICNLLGNIHSKLNKPEEAIRFYRSALTKALEVNYPSSIQESQSGLANYYNRTNHPDSAIHYAMEAYDGSKKIKGFEIMKKSANILRTAYEKKGDYAKALHFNDLAIAARDSVSGADKVREVQDLTYKEEKRQQKIQQEIETGKVAYQNKIKMYSLLAILGGVLLLAIILYRNYRQKHRANTLLQEQKEEIKEQRNQIQHSLEELKSAQAQLIQSEKMASLGELTAGIAHEIQNPLNFVNNFSELNTELIEELRGEQGKKVRDVQLEVETLDTIEENSKKILLHGKRAESIVRSMLEHSQTKPGERTNTNINALTEEYLKLSYHAIRAKDKSFNVNIITELDPAIPPLKIIPGDIGRVLINIFNNAFYSMNEKKNKLDSSYTPTLTIQSVIHDKHADLIIKDTGLGIPQIVLSKIFQPFFTTKPTGNGTGLGLSLSYDIITKAHGGSIAAESEEGEYCIFIISLPLT